MDASHENEWRVIFSGYGTGAWNMAVDEALLESVGKREAPPTLRYYGWEPGCLSLGYGQRFREVDEAGLRKHGWHVVRRPTGGRAILHIDELTYSVTAPADHPLVRGDVLESYRRISSGLLRGLERLAVPAGREENYRPDEAGGSGGPVCFEVPSHWEITFEEKKLIGSAQVRRRAGVLQHGTLPLAGDLRRITLALAFPDEQEREQAAARLIERAVTVEAAIGRDVPWRTAAAEMTAGFQEALGIRFSEAGLTPDEALRARELEIEKYGADEWTKRRA